MRRGRWRGRGEGDEERSKQGWWECEREGRKRRKAGRSGRRTEPSPGGTGSNPINGNEMPPFLASQLAS